MEDTHLAEDNKIYINQSLLKFFHRSVVSVYHATLNVNPVGKHSRVCVLKIGIFNNEFLKPRFCFVWDIEKVLSYLNVLLDNGKLSIKVLIHKLALLLASTAASRTSESCNLNTRCKVKTDTKFIFIFSKLTKTCRTGKSSMSNELSFLTVRNCEFLKLSNSA